MKKPNPLKDLPKYFLIFNSKVKSGLYFVVALTLLLGALEGIGIVMFLPFVASLLRSGQVTTGNYTQQSITQNFSNDSEISALQFVDLIIGDSLIGLLLLICLTFFSKGLVSFFALNHINTLRANLQYELKTEMLNSFSRATFAAHSLHGSGHFINVFQEQITKTLTAFNSLVTLVSHFILAVVFIILAFAFHWEFGLVVSVFGTVILISFKFINTKVRELSRAMASQNSSISNFAIQFFLGARYLRSTASMNQVFERKLKPLINAVKKHQVVMGRFSAITVSAREPVAVAVVLFAFFIQLSFFVEGVDALLIAVVFIYRAVNMAWSVQNNLQKTLENIGSLEIVDQELTFLSKREEIDRIQNRVPINSDVLMHFDDVSFRHETEGEMLLNNLNLSIRKRAFIAITGKSGGGKSTLFDLISLLYDPNDGAIGFAAGSSVTGTLSRNEWRRRIGYVTQEPVLFNGSIEDNIIFSDAHIEDSRKAGSRTIEDCLNLAGAGGFVNSMKEGIQTNVGEQGKKLSGGQKQRIALARELYKDPDLLLLDEPTSSLDAESTSIILNSLAGLKGQLSIVIITHELVTLEYADEIYVIDDGRVQEKGTLEELMSKNNSTLKNLFDYK